MLSPPDVDLKTEQVSCTHCRTPHGKRLCTERYELAGASVELGINRCRKCRLIYVSPRLTPDATRFVYELDTSHTISHAYCWEGNTCDSRFDALIERLARASKPGRLLDVGCGGGNFLRAAKRKAIWDVVGLEPIEHAAQQAERYAACEIRHTTLEQAGFPHDSFAVVSMLGVLEHVHDPIEVLKSARSLLQSDGLLAVYVPNFNYLRLKDTGPVCFARTRRWSKLHPQEHLHQFTPQTLLSMLTTCGFEVLRTDVGKPFLPARGAKRFLKQSAYAATCGLKALTGIHLGGLEVIARVAPRASADRAAA